MLEIARKLKERPEKERRMAALLISAFLTIVIFSLWAVNLNRKLSLSSGEDESPAAGQAASPFSSLKEAFGRASDGIGGALGGFRALDLGGF